MTQDPHAKRYHGLYNLMEADDEAEEYFDALPEYIKDTICQRAENVCSREDLQDYAENLLHSDL